MLRRVSITSTSRQEDAALTALADLAEVIEDWTPCRVIGGQMVNLHVALSGAAADHRSTADADLAAPVRLLGADRFAERLAQLGYRAVDGSRLSRSTPHGQALIDLVGPAPASRALHNQRAGPFSIDKFPGVQFALQQPPVHVEVEACRFEGRPLSLFRVAVPTLTASIVVKSLAASRREKDRRDVLRLLTAAKAAGTVLPDAPYDNRDVRRAAEYLHGPFLIGSSQAIRALVASVVPRPPERIRFLDL